MKFKNFSIKRRIILSNVSMILVPLIIIAIVLPVFIAFLGSFLNFDTVTTTQHNVISQFQWNFTIDEINNSIRKNGFEGNNNVAKSIGSIENYNSKVLLQRNGATVYLTNGTSEAEILNSVKSIDNTGSDLFSLRKDGLTIISNLRTEHGNFKLTIINKDYIVDYQSSGEGVEPVNFLAGKMGIVIVSIVGVFVLSIVVISIITASGIKKPINQLRQCTNEISNGNLEYVIEYDSTNEFGQLIKDFDQMRNKLKELLHKQDLLERQRKEMIAGFSHDLRTPLTSIKGYVEGLMDGIATTHEKQNQYLKTIYTTASDMENLVNELFLFSKLDVDKVTLEKENVAIIDYLTDCYEEQVIELKKFDTEIEFNITCSKETMVSIDRSKFGRVMLNIFSNSVKYKKQNQTGKIQMSVSNNEKYAIIRISDNGTGIDEESVKHVFETFYRADPARTNVREGSGLGLSICKQIVDLHDGNIWATGEIGVGMTVNIALPIV